MCGLPVDKRIGAVMGLDANSVESETEPMLEVRARGGSCVEFSLNTVSAVGDDWRPSASAWSAGTVTRASSDDIFSRIPKAAFTTSSILDSATIRARSYCAQKAG